MAITFSQEIFEKICSSATHSTAEVYDMIAPHLDDTLQSINCVLLGDMADKLDTVPDSSRRSQSWFVCVPIRSRYHNSTWY